MDEPKQIGSFENLLWAHPDIAESVEPSLLMLRQLAHQMAKNQTDGQTLSPNGFDVPILFRLTMGRMILETDREAFEAALSFSVAWGIRTAWNFQWARATASPPMPARWNKDSPRSNLRPITRFQHRQKKAHPKR